MATTRALRIHAAHDMRMEDVPLRDPGPGEVVVAMERGGICREDLNYLSDGRARTSVVREPMILGREVSGRICDVGPQVNNLKVGHLVAVNPSQPCVNCRYCRGGLPNQCLNIRFMGSALNLPHENGGFRDRMVVAANRCVPMLHSTPSAAACVESLAICLRAARLSPAMMGTSVLVTGAGPVGVTMTALARRNGAGRVIVTDVSPAPLKVAASMGATETHLAGSDLSRFAAEKGLFDIAFECSGSEPAIRAAIAFTRPGGTIIQIGQAGEVTLSIGLLVAKELNFHGAYRFHSEFAEAARMIDEQTIDVTPMISATVPFAEADRAFQLAADRARAVKVHLNFAPH